METPKGVWAAIRTMAFAPDGRTLLTTSVESVQLWDTATGKPAGPALARGSRSDWPPDVAFRPDGKAVVMTSPDQKVRLWDPVTGKPIGQPLALPGIISAAAFSSDGRLLVTGSPDRIARLWQADTGKLRHALPHPREIRRVAFAPDDRTFVTVAWDHAARVWDAATGQLLATLPHRHPVLCLAFSPDGRALLTASSPGSGLVSGGGDRSDIGGEVRLWDVATGSLLGPPLMHRYKVMCLAFSPDGRTFLTGNGDLASRYFPFHIDAGTAWLWQTADSPGPVVGHTGSITSAAFSPTARPSLRRAWTAKSAFGTRAREKPPLR
jgi:WD40 repeat protein